MRYLGLDLGNRTLGVAVSDAMGIIATGVETYRFKEKDLQNALNYVKMVVADRQIDKVVLGLPKNMDGTEGSRTDVIRAFAALVSEYTDVPIDFYDERMTTMQAYRFLDGTATFGKKRKSAIDTLSAEIILQNYLDRERNLKK